MSVLHKTRWRHGAGRRNVQSAGCFAELTSQAFVYGVVVRDTENNFAVCGRLTE
jgi:hypothetical protein